MRYHHLTSRLFPTTPDSNPKSRRALWSTFPGSTRSTNHPGLARPGGCIPRMGRAWGYLRHEGLTMSHQNLNDVRSEALFASTLQPSDDPTAAHVRQEIMRTVR